MKRTDELSSLADIFGPVIMSYTRAQALEDGVLVDAGPLARPAGFHRDRRQAFDHGAFAQGVPSDQPSHHAESHPQAG